MPALGNIVTRDKTAQFMDENGNYYIFLESQICVKKYNNEGVMIQEYPFEELVDLPYLRVDYIPPYKPNSSGFWDFYQDIVFKNEIFYILRPTLPGDWRNQTILHLYVIDTDLNILEKKLLNLKNGIDITGDFDLRFEVIDDDVYLPLVKNGEILKFTMLYAQK